jgi:hypothetical protein
MKGIMQVIPVGASSLRAVGCLRNKKILRSFILDILGTLAHFSSFETVPLWWNFFGVEKAK